MASIRRLWGALPWVLGLSVGACAGADEGAGEVDGPEPLGEAVAAATVQQAVSGGCSTTSVLGLSKQIVEQVNCLVPGALAEVPSRPNFTKSAATFPFLQTAGRDALVKALDANPSKTLNVTSMLRTVAQQYLLYAWSLSNSCGIELAAKPGNSNHESGQALDTGDYNAWKSILQGHGFKWYGTADDVHFDYVGAGTIDLKGKDVLAFQMLWNKNHPEDKIGEDGAYGPQTEARLKQSPAEGFPTGPSCGPPEPPKLEAQFVGQGSDAAADPTGEAHFQVCAGAEVKFWFELRNTGAASWVDWGDGGNDWGQRVRLGVPGDKADPLTGATRISLNDATNPDVHPPSWTPPGPDCNDQPFCQRTVFAKNGGISGKAPPTPGIVKTEWQLVDEGRAWFGPGMYLAFRVVDCGPPPQGGAGGEGQAGEGQAGEGQAGEGQAGEGQAGGQQAGAGGSASGAGGSPQGGATSAGSGGTTSAGGAPAAGGATSAGGQGGSSAGGGAAAAGKGDAGASAGGSKASAGSSGKGGKGSIVIAADGEEPSGCGCRAAGAAPGPGGLLAAVSAVALLGARRRRAGRS